MKYKKTYHKQIKMIKINTEKFFFEIRHDERLFVYLFLTIFMSQICVFVIYLHIYLSSVNK